MIFGGVCRTGGPIAKVQVIDSSCEEVLHKNHAEGVRVEAPEAWQMVARGKREARRPWIYFWKERER